MRGGLGLLFAAAIAAACAKPTLYEQWGQKLVALPTLGGSIEDVSLLLGEPPNRCETIESTPAVGIYFDQEQPVVAAVLPGSPGQRAGIRVGEKLVSVGGMPVKTHREAVSALRRRSSNGAPLSLVTDLGSYEVRPEIMPMNQCYWEVSAGEVATARSGAYVNPYGGAANAGSAAYKRFFRASCRESGGFVVSCSANWQQ